MNTFTSILMSFAFIATSTAFAGPKFSTRADVIILPDDSVVLADPFIDAQATQEGGGPLLQLLNPRIYQTIAIYQKVSLTAPFVSDDVNKIYESLLNKRTKLRFFGLESAEEMNKYCFAGRPIYSIPLGGTVRQAACTNGNDTFIVKPLFLKLSIRDQAMLLIHERLTTISDDRGWINFVAIAKYTTGLNAFLNIYNEQIKRVYRELTDLEQKNIYNFYYAIFEIVNRNSDYGKLSTFNWNVHKNGGGLTHVNAAVDTSAFISLNSNIAEKSELLFNTKVINLTRGNTSRYYAIKIKIAENSSIVDLDINNEELVIGANSTIKNSYIYADLIRIGDNVSITDSKVSAKSFILKNSVELKRAEVNYVLKYSNKVDAIVAENQQLIDQIISANDKDLYLPQGIVPRPFITTIKVNNFKCVTNSKSELKSWGWTLENRNANGDGSTVNGWTTYNGRNGLKKEYEYNYSDVKIEISLKHFERAKAPVVLLTEQGLIVPGDYLKLNEYINVPSNECTSSAVERALSAAGLPYVSEKGYKVPFGL